MDAPRDTDRDFFNAVLAGEATDNYINEYIAYSDTKGQLENLARHFLVELVTGKGFSGGWVNQLGSNTRWYVDGISPTYTNVQLNRLNDAYKRITNYQKSHKTTNTQLDIILQKACICKLIEYTGGKYKRLKPLVWLAAFADELYEKGFTPNRFAYIEKLFNEDGLSQAFYRLGGQSNKEMIDKEISDFFKLTE